jgi:RNA polymerase sigma-70 factor (ECF subfamily)
MDEARSRDTEAGSVELRARAASAARLAERVRSGDRDAEADLVERYGRGVRFLLGQLTGGGARSREEIEDLAQETFRLAIGKLRAGELRESEKLEGFLRSLARNLFLAEVRKRRRRRTEALEPEREAALRDRRPDPERDAERLEDVRRVRRLLAELEPPRDREILLRFYLAEEPKETICRDLGLSSVHFNRVIHRARHRFRTLIERRAPELGEEARR